MKINKFKENYEFDYEGDIGEEYAKFIISKFIDEDLDGKSLEQVYREVANELIDETDDDEDSKYDRADMVRAELIDYAEKLYKMARKVREVIEIDANKYNL